ncbi:MAG: methyltransferase domain-containing protein [Opitutaceae bacterium]|nr:methyltransferase domain-containing protein [Opitutaceae bacterium]
MTFLNHRAHAYKQLRGRGLEIGALHEPSPIPPGASVAYFDAIDQIEARRLFPEIEPGRFVPVTFKGDLDRDGLAQFSDGQFSFVIITHVIEHLSNPIKAVGEVFRITAPGGCVILAIPDKEFTFDRHREPTSFEHLQADHRNGVCESDDAHYLDFLKSAAPHVFSEPAENLQHHIRRARERREHAHVWTSSSFKDFLDRTFELLGIRATLVLESLAAENRIECFTMWRKG